MEIVKISNGFLLVHGTAPYEWIHCNQLSEVQQHLEMILLNQEINSNQRTLLDDEDDGSMNLDFNIDGDDYE